MVGSRCIYLRNILFMESACNYEWNRSHESQTAGTGPGVTAHRLVVGVDLAPGLELQLMDLAPGLELQLMYRMEGCSIGI
jgi:hypothetical protein